MKESPAIINREKLVRKWDCLVSEVYLLDRKLG